MKRILVPVDGSETALRAVEIASRIGIVFGSELLLPHVVVDGDDGTVPPGLEELAHAERMSRAEDRYLLSVSEQIFERAAMRAKALLVRSLNRLARTGRPGAVIVAVAREKAADLIVMGRHGSGCISDLLVGGVTARVMALSEFPCLSVK